MLSIKCTFSISLISAFIYFFDIFWVYFVSFILLLLEDALFIKFHTFFFSNKHI